MGALKNSPNAWCPDAWDGPVDWAVHNRGVTPTFYLGDPVMDYSGGEPVERQFEYVKINVAGDTLTEMHSLVDDKVRERFADAYAAWKAGTEKAIGGTPIREWPFVNLKQAKAMELANILSVEDLAALADGNIYTVQHGRAFREKAIAWLKDKAEGGAAAALAEEKAQMQGELEALRRQMAKLEAARAPKRKTKSGAARKPVSDETRAKLSEAGKRMQEAKRAAQATPPIQQVEAQ